MVFSRRLVVCALVALAGAATLTQTVRTQAPPAGGSVQVWLTTMDRANLLTPKTPVNFAPDSGSTTLTIDVDPSTTYQVMDGFGASFTDSSAWLVSNKLSASARQQLMLRLFDRSAGIGLSYLRQPIGASDFALAHYSFDDVPAGQTDPTLARFSIDHDRAYILPMLQQALQINPQLRIMATPWSAPGWMKSSGSMIGGSLLATAENVYANYLVKFIQAYQAEGVPIDRITPQNEPHFTPGDYPGMWMDATQAARFIGRSLGPAIAAAGLQTRIDAWDHNWNDTGYAPSVFDDPMASPFVAGSAWHCYEGTPDAMTAVHDLHPSREILFTECSGGYWNKSFRDAFEQDMETLIIGAPRNWARTIVKWNIALDTASGPHTGGCPNCTGLVTIDAAAGAVASFNYDYYSLGHISKFVVPGAVRIASNTFGSSSVQDVAFRNPDGSKVLIVFNGDAPSRTFKVREGGSSFTYTLPAGAAVTFTWTEAGGSGVTPTVAMTSPADGTAFSAPASIALSAEASSPAGISQVDFYAGSAVVGTAFTSPYSVAWNNVPVGNYSVRARAIGKDGGVAMSAPVWAVVVDANTDLAQGRPASASSVESGTYPASNAVDGNASTRWSSAFSDPQWISVDLGSRFALSKVVVNWEAAFAVSYQLQVSDDGTAWTTFYSTTSGRGGTETVTPASGVTGRYLRVYCTERTFVYGSQWGYSIWEVQAFGEPAGSTPPPPPPPPAAKPVVAISSPASGTTFTAPATIAIAATASEVGGTIARVDFYANSKLIGSDAAAPYGFTWQNVSPGSYSLTARATDAAGASATSAAVKITVKGKKR